MATIVLRERDRLKAQIPMFVEQTFGCREGRLRCVSRHGFHGLTQIQCQSCLSAAKGLEVQLQAELKLPRIECCGRAAVITAIAGALIERVDIVDERRRGGFVEPIEEVEAFGNQFQTHALTDRHQLRQTQIQRHVAVRQTEVTTQASARKHAIRDQTNTARGSGNAQRTVSEHGRTIRLVRLVVVRVLVAENVEWTSRRDLEDWCEREVRQRAMKTTAAACPRARRRKNRAEHEAMSLIE